jgi:hypothetical protein
MLTIKSGDKAELLALAREPQRRAALGRRAMFGPDLANALAMAGRASLLGRIVERLVVERLDAAGPAAEGAALELGRSWRLIHHVLIAASPPGETQAATLLLGGREIGPDFGAGPARILEPRPVCEFAAFLVKIAPRWLHARIDAAPETALEFYSAAANLAPAQRIKRLKETIDAQFPRLRTYVAAAAARRDGLIFWMS